MACLSIIAYNLIIVNMLHWWLGIVDEKKNAPDSDEPGVSRCKISLVLAVQAPL